jgi:hypothetical protein
MSLPITDNQWAEIDVAIFDNRILEAVKGIRVLAKLTLVEAQIAFYERYELLRSEAPERFTRTNREYWSNFYTDGPQPPMAEPGTMPDWTDL